MDQRLLHVAVDAYRRTVPRVPPATVEELEALLFDHATAEDMNAIVEAIRAVGYARFRQAVMTTPGAPS